ncbi:glu/gln-tRNA synthetase [Pontimonas salivibrio]|uniref:Glutamate--tRNA ligase n=1 Tax=Pontimonas salivibrio TaxID=1159327 RepID=A0A2L2BPF6_9MICO|nr:glutamate--tRNA ligase [Pontimonas salivibrio]AVG23551.1 glu/gln-tRNA synthetase [Pontimonas salivibrio]
MSESITEVSTTQATGADIRVRFCPSPTGTPHVGLIRTALFNWAYARHHGGAFVFRIEDTDQARDSEDSYHQLLDAMGWLGLNWDEGVEVGGPHGPYRQSERGDIYRDIINRLLEAGHLYESFVTPEEMAARNLAQGRGEKQGYDNHERNLTDAERQAFLDDGRTPALRLKVPDGALDFVDLVRGPVSFPAGSTTDFVLVRPNGAPLYTFVNPVDDALMGITHVLRGEDLLSSTPRQIALYHALIDIGVASEIPRFGHLPYVMGENNKKLSKRDPESNLFLHRERGFIPEGLLNYLALLGWSIAPDRDVFTLEEMIAAFDVADVNPNPARFDQKKAESINGDHLRMLAPEDFLARCLPYLQDSGLIGAEPTASQREVLTALLPHVQPRVGLLGEVPGMVGFALTADQDLEITDEGRKTLREGADDVLDASVSALEGLESWTTGALEETLREALVEGMELSPRHAFTPLRVAISGRRVSPPLFESMEILGKDSSLARLRSLRQSL